MRKLYSRMISCMVATVMAMTALPLNVFAEEDMLLVEHEDYRNEVLEEYSSSDNIDENDSEITLDSKDESVAGELYEFSDPKDKETGKEDEEESIPEDVSNSKNKDIVNETFVESAEKQSVNEDNVEENGLDVTEVLSADLINNDGAAAAEWLDYYNYELDTAKHQVIITSSNGKFQKDIITEIIVPAQTVIEGEVYTTVLDNSAHFKEYYENNYGSSSYWYLYTPYSLWNEDADVITSIKIEEGVIGGNIIGLFANMHRLTEIDFKGLDTSMSTDMSFLFCKDDNLTELDLSGLDTSMVKDMGAMFAGCCRIKSLDLTGFNTSQVSNMESMFDNMTALEEVDLSSFDTSIVRDMSFMFFNCQSLMSLDVSNFDTVRVMDYFGMFGKLSKHIEALDLRNFYINREAYTKAMFGGCTLYNLYLGVDTLFDYDFNDYDYSNVHNDYFYYYCDIYHIYYEGSPEQWRVLNNGIDEKTQVITDFSENIISPRITEDRGHAVDTGWYKGYYNYFINKSTRKLMLTASTGKYKTEKITEIRVPAQTIIDGIVYTTVLDSCGNSLWFEDRDILTAIIFEEGVEVSPDCSYMFSSMPRLSMIDASGLNTRGAINMSYMFEDDPKLKELNLANLDTSSVWYMDYMFYEDTSLTELDLGSFDTSLVWSMNNMFADCVGISTLNLSMFDTGRVRSMNNMFYGMTSLLYVDLSGFNTSNVDDMGGMFGNCVSLMELDLSSFNTAKVTNYANMFYSLSSYINTLDLRSFYFGRNADTYEMFNQSGIINLYLPKIAVSSYDFTNHDWNYVDNILNIYYEGSKAQWDVLDNVVKDETEIIYNFNKSIVYPKKTMNMGKAVTSNWYEGYYDYYINRHINKLVLKSSTGKYAAERKTQIRVPAQTVIDGEVYTTVLDSNRRSLWAADSDILTTIIIDEGVETAPVCSSLFSEMPRLTTLDITGLNTDNVVDMSGMFRGAYRYDDVYGDYGYASLLTSLNLSNFNTSQVRYMNDMFRGCSDLLMLDLSSFDTHRTVSMDYMFEGAKGLKDVVLSSFDTSNVISMQAMFLNCSGLCDLNLSNFNTVKVANYNDMFCNLSPRIRTLDLRSFTILSNAQTSGMLYGNNVLNMYLSKSTVEYCTFSESVTDIYYEGTKLQWDSLNNYIPDGCTVHYEYVNSLLPLDKIVVSFEPNGGNIKRNKKIISKGSIYGTMPLPELTGYEFVGWYTALEGGELIEASTDVSAEDDHTLYAHWEELPDYVAVSGITFAVSELALQMEVKEVGSIEATVSPDNASNKKIIWSTSNESVAVVDGTGVVTAISPGSATITAKTEEGNYKAVAAVTVAPQPDVVVTKVEIDKPESALRVGRSLPLSVLITPDNATNKRIIWNSKNTEVASVDNNGRVTAHSAGITEIIATAEGTDIYDKWEVRVIPVEITGIYVMPADPVLNAGESVDLSVIIRPSDATTPILTYMSGDTTVATVTNTGKVTAVSPGKAEITVSVKDTYIKDKCMVTVSPVAVEGVNLNSSYQYMEEGSVYKLQSVVIPDNATNKDVRWSSDNPDVASVDGTGEVTAKSEGVAIITVTTDDGNYQAECTVEVYKPAPEVINVDYITINKAELTLKLGEYESETLTVEVTPADATDKRVMWSSQDSGIASVDGEGNVIAIAAGTTIITVTSLDGGYEDECTVTVIPRDPIAVTGVTLDSNSLQLNIGEQSKLTATVIPDNADNKMIIWTTSDSDKVSVDQYGNIKAHSIGEAVITATAQGTEVSASCSVKVNPIAVSGVEITDEKLTLKIGSTITGQLTARILPVNASNQNITWSSSEESVATVDSNGFVKAISEGTAIVTVTTEDGNHTDSCEVTVLPRDPVYVTNIVLETSKDIYIGDKVRLIASVEPLDADNKSISWSSNAPDIVTVDPAGFIEGLAVGKAIITATADGTDEGVIVSTSCEVTVKEAEPEPQPVVNVTGVTLDKNTYRMLVGDKFALTATVSPMDATNKSVFWSSDKPDIAEVDANGNVSAKLEGNAKIIVSTEDGGFEAYCEVTVEEAPEEPVVDVSTLTIDQRELSMVKGETRSLHAFAYPSNANAVINYISSDTDIVEIKRLLDENGSVNSNAVELVAVNEGSATVTAKAGNIETTCKVIVTDIDIDDWSEGDIAEKQNTLWIGKIPDETYDGNAKKPEPNVYFGYKKLISGTDYKLSYANNKNAGKIGDTKNGKKVEPTVTVSFKGDYSGKLSKPFNILQAELSTALINDVFGYVKSKTKNGVVTYTQQQLAPIVEFNGKKLKQGVDYILEYADAGGYAKEGNYEVKVLANENGNFTGNVTIHEILRAKSDTVIDFKSVKVVRMDGTGNMRYTGKSTRPVYELRYKPKGSKDYVVINKECYREYYSDDINPGTCKVIFVADEDPYFGTVSTTYKIAVVKETLKNNDHILVSLNDYEDYEVPYLKGGVKPSVTVKYDRDKLIEGVDYKVSYKNNNKLSTTKSTGKIVITGIGRFKDSYTQDFKVIQQDIGNLNIRVDDFTYSNKPNAFMTAKITIYDLNGKALASSDYTLDKKTNCSDNDDWSVYGGNDTPDIGNTISVTVHGKGYYKGKITGSFRVVDKAMRLDSAKVKFVNSEKGSATYNIAKKGFIYKGTAVEPDKSNMTVELKVKVKEGNKTITRTVNPTYEIVGYENNLKTGTAKVTLRGTGDFGGLKTISFKIISAK